MTHSPRSLVLVACLLSACGGAGISTSVHVIDELTDPAAVAVCARGDVAANLAIVSDLRDSYHEMIVCGGLQLQFEQNLVNVIANLALGRGQASQLRYQGNGVFATPNGMMMIRTLTMDGRALVADALDPNSYLIGVKVNVNAGGLVGAASSGGGPWSLVKHASAALDLQFSGQGPLFSLLDLGANGGMSGRLLLDPKKLAKAIAKNIQVANRISVDNQQGGTTVHYILEGDPQPLSDTLDHKAVPMKLASIVATHEATGQTIRVTDWTMQFKGDGGKVLDGTIALDVDGGAFPYAVKFSYPHRMDPDIDLTCR
ncbi:MAG TPA: hypothetical protein VN253_26490 [Kofleriaceae bacterium]|nr:hypothetical protein [Kofleriaceae bacterium]